MKPKQADPFYLSPAWRQLRRKVLRRDHYRCVECKRSVMGIGRARVDHILPRKLHPHLAMMPGNLRTLCVDCDNELGGRSPRLEVQACDVAGMPTDPRHPWNSTGRHGVGVAAGQARLRPGPRAWHGHDDDDGEA